MAFTELDAAATYPTILNTALTVKDTEYPTVLPRGTRSFTVSIRGGVSTDTFRVAYVTGKVAGPTAPYISYPANVEYIRDKIYAPEDLTIYIASSADTKVAQIEIWI